jgi:hypothetical protein
LRPIARVRDVTVEPKEQQQIAGQQVLRGEIGAEMAKKLIEIHKGGEIVTVSW